MRMVALVGATLAACSSGSGNPDEPASCQKIHDEICIDAEQQGVGPTPCIDDIVRYRAACDKLRDECPGKAEVPCPP